MNISGINISSQNNVSSKQPTLDSHESSLRKQITNLQEEMKTISNDKEMSDEQRTKKKQAAQEELQNLNSELRQYQMQKRQEEAAKKQEAAKEALKNANSKPAPTDDDKTKTAGSKTADAANDKAAKAAESTSSSENDEEQMSTLLGSKESGVLVTLSSTKEQIAGMGRIRTALEGRQRTAPTEEEKADLQKKIDRVSRGIGKKIVITEDTISSFRKTSKDEPGRRQETANALKQREKELKVYADEKLDAINRTGVINNKKMFDNISIIFN